ncbi:Uncharacterised protein [Myroides odoratus]|uniref:DUF4349 domain-containing protein n=2 Tax=Myroides odoratus TaxID=256 RepID=A0A9Q7EBA3_MYROD|nr:hypothetical protein Myrod_2066 [Myroides odoratus DSM 2801]EKB07474.1 hypothetical protein HMPREF9716_01924 [Myroides odoratus CIP 103059]QQU00245.1 DUF4349 domain-containing protein [Myroides odoratus]STZ30161.1 Uncharacterised protein [Myroides odoratus]
MYARQATSYNLNKNAMKKIVFHTVIGVIFLLTFASCNKKYDSVAAETADYLSLADTDSSPAKNLEAGQTVERKIIKEGSIRFETANAAATRKQITAALATYKGYLAQDQSETYASQSVYTLTLRIPAENFEKLLTEITTAAQKVDNQDIKALDVTEEFIDVESRIQTKKELENRYKALLSKANKVEEILAIEKEIEALRSDIESYEGRLNYLKSSIAYSTLTAVFYEKQTTTTTFGSEFSTAIGEGWDNLVSFTLGLFYIWPFILILLAILFFVRRKIKRRKLQNK